MRFHNIRHGNWWGVLDTVAHFLHLPRFIQNPICDRFDESLGMYDPPTHTSGAATQTTVTWSRPKR